MRPSDLRSSAPCCLFLCESRVMDLPRFKYHPDPLASGSVERCDAACVVCGELRGVLYAGPIHGEAEPEGRVCPWCIADGSAHEQLGIELTDLAGVGGYADGWPSPPPGVAEEVAWRTPGFYGWQQERWYTCCSDAAAFLGRAGAAELAGTWREARGAIELECGLEGEELDEYMRALSREGSPTAYVFQCLHCGKYGGYSDCH
jgi:uncharacterized protein CbrC (UPF0167 family)